jgi:class 3 adenylate cyclase
MVSDIARTLAAASGFDLEPRGTRELKGLDGPRTLFALRGPATRP